MIVLAGTSTAIPPSIMRLPFLSSPCMPPIGFEGGQENSQTSIGKDCCACANRKIIIAWCWIPFYSCVHADTHTSTVSMGHYDSVLIQVINLHMDYVPSNCKGELRNLYPCIHLLGKVDARDKGAILVVSPWHDIFLGAVIYSQNHVSCHHLQFIL